MKKMDFTQMEVVRGGEAIRPCVVGKYVTGIGLILLGAGVPFACPAAALGFGITPRHEHNF
jgi:hypothetical protein